MKALHPLSMARLSVLEFGQHLKSINTNIGLLGGGFITDNNMINYLTQLAGKSAEYDLAMKHIAKSDETAKIAAADRDRDLILKTMQRQLSVFEYSKNENQHLAYLSLSTLFNVYKNIQQWNYEEETNGIDNLVIDMQSTKYAPHVAQLGLQPTIEQLIEANKTFKILFNNRTQEIAGKEVYNVKALRADLKTVYSDFCNYVLSMAKALNQPQYIQSLQVINAVRKYYDDRLSTRKPTKKGETATAIPPMET